MPPVDRTYYDLLDLPPNCSESDVKSAYKTKARLLHPDKPGGDKEAFQKMKEAYDVIADPNRRRNYDKYGAAGLRVMEGNMSNPQDALILLTRSGKCCIVSFLLFFSSALLSPVVLIALRWDEIADYAWAIAFIPLWIFHFIMYIVLALIRAPKPPEDEEGADVYSQLMYETRKKQARATQRIGVVNITLLVGFEVLAALRLDDVVDLPWVVVAIPLFVLELFLCGLKVCSVRATHTKAQLEAMIGARPLPPARLSLFLMAMLWWGLLRLVTVILLALRADEVFEASWFICGIPFMVGGLLNILGAWGRKKLADAVRQQQLDQGRQLFRPEEQQEPGCLGACCWVSFMLTVVCGGASKLDGADSYSAFFVFLPAFVLVFCCFCVLAIIVCNDRPEARSGFEEGQQGWPPGSHPGAPGASAAPAAAETAAGGGAASQPTVVGAPTASSGAWSNFREAASDDDQDLRPGMAVTLHDLNASELNGLCGKLEFREETGRWAVRLPSDEVKAFKPCNLRRVDGVS